MDMRFENGIDTHSLFRDMQKKERDKVLVYLSRASSDSQLPHRLNIDARKRSYLIAVKIVVYFRPFFFLDLDDCLLLVGVVIAVGLSLLSILALPVEPIPPPGT